MSAYPPHPSASARSLNPLDWATLGAAFLAFVFSFFAFYTYDLKGALLASCKDYVRRGLVSSSNCDGQASNAWHGFFGWFGVLLALAGALAIATSILTPDVRLPLPARLVGVGGLGLGVVCTLLALAVVPDYKGGGPGYDASVDEGHGLSYWIVLVLLVAALVLAIMRLQQTGGARLSGALATPPEHGYRPPPATPPLAGGPPSPPGYPPPPPPPPPPPQ